MERYLSQMKKWVLHFLLTSCFLITGCAGMFVQEELPTIAHVHIGHAATGWKHTPEQKGLFNVAEDLAKKALDDSLAAQQAKGVDARMGHIKEMLLAVSLPPAKAEKENEFSLEVALEEAVNHITFAAESDDASQNVKDFSDKFEKNAEKVLERSNLIAALGREVLSSTSEIEMEALIGELVQLNKDNVYGGNGNSKVGLQQLRTSLDGMINRENPAYEPVATRYLFGLVRLPDGKWAFSWLLGGDDSFSVRGY